MGNLRAAGQTQGVNAQRALGKMKTPESAELNTAGLKPGNRTVDSVDPVTFYSPNCYLQIAGPLYFDERNQPMPGQQMIAFSPLMATEKEMSGRGQWGLFTTTDPKLIAHLWNHMDSQRDGERDVYDSEGYQIKSKAETMDLKSTEVMVTENIELKNALQAMQEKLSKFESGDGNPLDKDKTDA